MPPRHLILMILAFWLATTGWLFYRDLWPRLLPDEPPPFTIELADEVSEQKIYWKLFENGKDKGYAFSWVQYRPDDDTFDVSSEFKLFSKGRGKDGQENPDQVVESSYRVTRTGELRRVQAQVSVTTLGIQARITGRVDGPWLRPHLRLESPSFEMDQDLKPVAVSHRGSVLNPLQPLNRIQGLRPGQHWRVPLIDPLEEALNAFMHRAVDPGFLDAEVLPEPEALTWGPVNHQRTDACLVISYRGEEYQARTWVRARDGLVLRQEATHHGVTMALQRD